MNLPFFLQETAAAVGVTAAAKNFLRLSGPVRAMILLNLGSAMFGSNQVAMKLTENQGVDPTTISAIRFSIAAIFFLPGVFRGLKAAPLTLVSAEAPVFPRHAWRSLDTQPPNSEDVVD